VSAASCPQRIVSLVPSLTESLFALGLGGRVVAATEYCVHPADALAGVPRLGGTKNPDVRALLALRPDLVVANREENTERVVRQARAAGVRVLVTYPRSVREGLEVLEELAALGATEARRRAVVDPVRAALEHAESSPPARPTRVFCPIWRDPWMSVGADTYAHDLLRLCGGENVFAARGERRYPRVSLDDVDAAAPEVILLPDEPYAFGPEDARELARRALPAARSARIHSIDGTLLTWYGPRIERALREVRALLVGSRQAGSGHIGSNIGSNIGSRQSGSRQSGPSGGRGRESGLP